MDEQKETTAVTTTNSNTGVQPAEFNKVERAEQAVKRAEEFEKRIDEKIAHLEELKADRLLGSTAGGHIEAQPVKEETAKEYADRVMKNNIPVIKDGTGN